MTAKKCWREEGTQTQAMGAEGGNGEGEQQAWAKAWAAGLGRRGNKTKIGMKRPQWNPLLCMKLQSKVKQKQKTTPPPKRDLTTKDRCLEGHTEREMWVSAGAIPWSPVGCSSSPEKREHYWKPISPSTIIGAAGESGLAKQAEVLLQALTFEST